MRDVDILARLTTVRWVTGAELTAELAKYYRRSIAVADVLAMTAALEASGLITRRPCQEADHRYGVAEYQLTEVGVRERVQLSATAYDPFSRTPLGDRCATSPRSVVAATGLVDAAAAYVAEPSSPGYRT